MLKGSATVVAYAIISNFVVMVMKWVAYVHTGSAAMLSETIHSLVDMLNQCLLAIGILSSIQQPDPDHPILFFLKLWVLSCTIRLLTDQWSWVLLPWSRRYNVSRDNGSTVTSCAGEHARGEWDRVDVLCGLDW
jgi:hypothetical protein